VWAGPIGLGAWGVLPSYMASCKRIHAMQLQMSVYVQVAALKKAASDKEVEQDEGEHSSYLHQLLFGDFMIAAALKMGRSEGVLSRNAATLQWSRSGKPCGPNIPEAMVLLPHVLLLLLSLTGCLMVHAADAGFSLFLLNFCHNGKPASCRRGGRPLTLQRQRYGLVGNSASSMMPPA
jgi:hypothetical protein